MKTKARKCETRNEDDAETRYIRKRSNRSWRNSTIVLHELFSRAALRGTYPPFIRAFEQLRRSEEEKGGARVDSGGVPSVAAIEPRLLVRILQTFHRVANALDQNSHETGAPSGARDISSSSRAPISIVATLFALQICDKVNAFGLAPPLAVQSSSSSGKLDASSSGGEKIGRTRPTISKLLGPKFRARRDVKETRLKRCRVGSRQSDRPVAVFRRPVACHRSEAHRERIIDFFVEESMLQFGPYFSLHK